jgi:hypothetical protein
MTKQRLTRPLRQNTELRVPAFPDIPFKKSSEWDADIFAKADYFRVTLVIGPGTVHSHRYNDLLDAMRAAVYKKDGRLFRNPKAMVYVVASDNRSFCIAPKDWLKYVNEWKAKHAQRV